MSELLDRLAKLEGRVAKLKDWKEKYEEEKGKWNEEREELIAAVGETESLKRALIQFLHLDKEPRLVGSSKETINLVDKELVVNVGHEEKEVNMTTKTVVGRILFCALTELSKEGWSEADLTDMLLEHGWNIPHNTLAPKLGSLVKDGTLIRLPGKPYKYRLPSKLKLNVQKAYAT